MTTLEERAPAGFFLTHTDRDALSELLARAEKAQAAMDDALRGLQRIVTGTTDLDPAVDLGDPLAMFRLPSGAVGYETTYADQITTGDWVQACHGDPGWHEVTGRSTTSDRTIGIELDSTHLRWWAPTDAIRRATPAADVVAGQERKAEA